MRIRLLTTKSVRQHIVFVIFPLQRQQPRFSHQSITFCGWLSCFSLCKWIMLLVTFHSKARRSSEVKHDILFHRRPLSLQLALPVSVHSHSISAAPCSKLLSVCFISVWAPLSTHNIYSFSPVFDHCPPHITRCAFPGDTATYWTLQRLIALFSFTVTALSCWHQRSHLCRGK